jgi:hypothetical protein
MVIYIYMSIFRLVRLWGGLRGGSELHPVIIKEKFENYLDGAVFKG